MLERIQTYNYIYFILMMLYKLEYGELQYIIESYDRKMFINISNFVNILSYTSHFSYTMKIIEQT